MRPERGSEKGRPGEPAGEGLPDRGLGGYFGPGDWKSRIKARHKGGLRGRIGHSLFLKLLLVLAAAAVLVNVCVGAFFRMAVYGEAHGSVKRNLEAYADFLAREIGNPPDPVRARRLAEDLSLQVRWDGPMGSWSSEPGLTAPPKGLNGHPHGHRGPPGWYRGRYYLHVERDGIRFLFATDFHKGERAHWPLVVGVLLCISFILGIAFLVIRRLLVPIRDLSHAVDRLGYGDLSARVPERRRRDELGDLSRAFNAMTGRIGDMLKSREQLLLDVSHELRSPLTRIKVALEMAPEGTAKDSIRDDLDEMDVMIGEILEAARLDSAAGRLNPEELDLAEICGDAAASHTNGKPHVTVRRTGGGTDAAGAGAFRVKADRERIRKVISNVVGNAVKYSREASGPVEVVLEAREDEVRIRVRDKGIGIPAEEIPKLFEPFYRVDRSRSRETGGYGLGLSLCKRIMEAHGGSISLESREGEGTTVELRLPRG
jgi:signal transduction histidine kinase